MRMHITLEFGLGAVRSVAAGRRTGGTPICNVFASARRWMTGPLRAGRGGADKTIHIPVPPPHLGARPGYPSKFGTGCESRAILHTTANSRALFKFRLSFRGLRGLGGFGGRAQWRGAAWRGRTGLNWT